MEFEWDASKEEENLKKHGVSFDEALTCFSDPDGFVLRDIKHSGSERRYFWIGRSKIRRILTTRFTRRGNRIRIFGSAEWRKFRRLYERTKIK